MVASSSGRSTRRSTTSALMPLRRKGLRSRRAPCRRRAAVGDERDVGAAAPYGCALDVDGSGVGAAGAGEVVERAVLEDDDRVGVLQRGPQHAAGVLERRRGEHAEAGDVRVPALEAVRVLRGELPAGAGRHADDERHRQLPAGHVRSVAALLRIWSSASRLKLTVMISTIGRIPPHRGADPGPGERRLGQGRVAHPVLAELLEQPEAHRERTRRSGRRPRP